MLLEKCSDTMFPYMPYYWEPSSMVGSAAAECAELAELSEESASHARLREDARRAIARQLSPPGPQDALREGTCGRCGLIGLHGGNPDLCIEALRDRLAELE